MHVGPLQKNALLMVGATGLVLAIAEITARALWDPGGYSPMVVADPTYGWRLNPNVRTRAVDTDRKLDYHVAVNSLGWRDPERTRAKRSGTKRVLMLGDSFVFGTGVQAGERCGDVVDRQLGGSVEVINAAVAGWGTDQQYIYLEREGFALEPDVVVLVLCLRNDVTNNMMERNLYGLAPKPRFELRDGALVHIPPAARPPRPWRVKLGHSLQHSRLLHYVGRRVRILRAGVRPRPAPSAEMPYYPEDLENDESQWTVYGVEYSPRFEGAFQVTEALITAMHDSCEARGIPFVLYAFPQQNEVDVEARQSELAHFGFAASWFDMERPYARIRALSKRLDCAYVYPLEAFRASNARATLFLQRDGHPNAAGHALAAQSLQSAIAAQLRLPIQRTQR